jgi:hypothetical protein
MTVLSSVKYKHLQSVYYSYIHAILYFYKNIYCSSSLYTVTEALEFSEAVSYNKQMMVWTEVISNCSKLVAENVILNDDDRVLHMLISN